MKRVFIMAVIAMITLHAAAQQLTNCFSNSYTGSLTATINGVEYVQPNDVSIEVEKDINAQTVTITLKDLSIYKYEKEIKVGTISVPDIIITEASSDIVNVTKTTGITIQNGEGNNGSWDPCKAGMMLANETIGEDEPYDGGWLGPDLGTDLPTTLTGCAWIHGIELIVSMHIEKTQGYNAQTCDYYNVVMSFRAGDVPTAINHVAESSCPAVAYTLDGRRAASGAKGIMIIDGKKVVK